MSLFAGPAGSLALELAGEIRKLRPCREGFVVLRSRAGEEEGAGIEVILDEDGRLFASPLDCKEYIFLHPGHFYRFAQCSRGYQT